MNKVLLILILLGPISVVLGVLISIINDAFPTCPAGFSCYPWYGVAQKFILLGSAWTITCLAIVALSLIVSGVYR